jgi:hypothetical protein
MVTKNNRHRAGCVLQCSHAAGGIGEDDVWHERDQFCRVFAKVVGNARCPTHLHPNIATFGPSQLL